MIGEERTASGSVSREDPTRADENACLGHLRKELHLQGLLTLAWGERNILKVHFEPNIHACGRRDEAEHSFIAELLGHLVGFG